MVIKKVRVTYANKITKTMLLTDEQIYNRNRLNNINKSKHKPYIKLEGIWMIKRSDIKGFTLKAFGYYLEFVFIGYLISVIALSRQLKRTIWRVERWL